MPSAPFLNVRRPVGWVVLLLGMVLAAGCDSTGSEVPEPEPEPEPLAACTDSTAGEYPRQNDDLLGPLSISDLGGERGVNLNDIWGWTDSQTGTEYALVGRTNGMAFVDISDPQRPVYIGEGLFLLDVTL